MLQLLYALIKTARSSLRPQRELALDKDAALERFATPYHSISHRHVNVRSTNPILGLSGLRQLVNTHPATYTTHAADSRHERLFRLAPQAT
jgi:hypothetical protein